MLNSLPDGYKIVIVGASGGIGRALHHQCMSDPRCGAAIALSRASTPATDFARPESIDVAANQIRADHAQIDALIIATGILTSTEGNGPEKAFSQLTPATMTELFNTNTIGPALVLSAFMPLLPHRGRCIVAALSARVGSIGDNGLGGWISYRASKAALNQVMHTAAIEMSRRNSDSICAALHPGTIETDLTRQYASGNYTHTAEECASNLLSVLDALTPDQSGGFYDYAGKEIVW